MKPINSYCPVCDEPLSETHKCPHGHFEYYPSGVRAADVVLHGDKPEWFHLDDMFSDWRAFEERVSAMREAKG